MQLSFFFLSHSPPLSLSLRRGASCSHCYARGIAARPRVAVAEMQAYQASAPSNSTVAKRSVHQCQTSGGHGSPTIGDNIVAGSYIQNDASRADERRRLLLHNDVLCWHSMWCSSGGLSGDRCDERNSFSLDRS
ncbi:hypothetical protein B0H16DRAFT_1453931 [Mycena metata]|uniref:Uncharacterized protein n=1 Tax=Mycena metata TaxID=1033252 RepID=A0AAD7JKR7_9AGAR|nr:hypothetical protein B0H16DRAFT_1453931 [Mycena metata]